MWALDNRTPFAAERAWVRDRDGAEIWLVAVKATFDISPDGHTRVAGEQPPVLRAPLYHGEPGRSSIRYDADLVRTKQTTDVTVVGHAHAPKGQPVERLDVGFRIGTDFQKVVKVIGDRRWGTLGASAPEPFVQMPLVYERAYGGVDPKSAHPEQDWDWRNPVGRGFAKTGAHLDGTLLPNIELPGQLISGRGDRPAPAGLGAIDCHWQPRASYAGTYGEAWMASRQPLLPDDFDDRYHQSAPRDQQAPQFLRGGEPVTLLNLSPLGNLRFTLPKVYLGFETVFFDGSHEIHRERRLHSVIFEPDFPRVSLVWHTALPCHHKVQKLKHTRITLKRDVSTGAPYVFDDDEAELAA